MRELIEKFEMLESDSTKQRMAWSEEIGRAMSSALKKYGDVFVHGSDGWGVNPLSVKIGNVSYPVHVAMQYFPKGGYNASVSVQSPMFAGRDVGYEDALDRVFQALRGMKSSFSKIGNVRVTEVGHQKWPQLWIEVGGQEDDEDSIKKMEKFAKQGKVLGGLIGKALVGK